MKKKEQTKTVADKWLIPIILVMGFIPVIVHMYEYNSNLSQFEWFPENGDSQLDFFFAWKMYALIAVGIVMGVILLYRYFGKKEKLRFENCFYLLFFYCLFVAMSALFSPYKYWVARGTYELFEPVWVVFVYLLLCYYVYQNVQCEKQVDFVLRWSAIGALIVTLIGVFQFLGLDFFRSQVGKVLISNTSWWGQLDQLNFSFPERTAYTTLYNPNFLSFYYGMLIPLVACLFVGTKQVWKRVLLAVLEILCLICMKASNSATGWVALGIGIAIFALVLASRNKKALCAVSTVVVLGVIAVLIFCNTTSAGQSIKNTIVGTYHMKDKFALNGVETKEDQVLLDIRGNQMKLSYSVEKDGKTKISCQDSEGKEIQGTVTDEENQIQVLSDERFAGIQSQPTSFGEDLPGITVTIEGVGWDFVNYQDSGYYYVNPAGKLVKYEKVRKCDLFPDDAMSMRGHIWDNTIPLLTKHLFVGSGANTFLFEYPQNDYISQSYVYGQNNFDVKAHCWYLQQWVENGFLAMLLLIGFCGWYLVSSIRIYRRADLKVHISWVGLGLFGAALVYMIVGIVNDSNVCTAPVFWGILGLGIAVNRMVVLQQGISEKKAGIEKSENTEKKQQKNGKKA